jgi:hypothetical protein
MLLAGSGVSAHVLRAARVRIPLVGRVRLRSAVPLGFVPGPGSDQPPLLLTGDTAGLERLVGLSGIYRTHSWLASLPTSGLHSWQLAGVERRLQQQQQALLSTGSQFSLTAPFPGLDAAREAADAAPQRLLLAGGGALAALIMFVLVVASGLRRDQQAELERLRGAGARVHQAAGFVVAEAALLCGVATLIGAIAAIAIAALLSAAAGEQVGVALGHSVITPACAAALFGGWLIATAVISLSAIATSARVGDAAAFAAAVALAVALSMHRDPTGNDPLPVLLAPLCCVAAGVLVFRIAATLLQGAERLARGGPLPLRLALIGLARDPAAPSLALAFVAVSVGLGGFALAYRATLLRSAADQAAERVPLDAAVSPGADFLTPLELAPASRWRALAGGAVWPVRRTDANFLAGGASVTVPALGVPAGAIERLHGWRSSDGPAPLATVARQLAPRGPVRTAGPRLPVGTRALALTVGAVGVGVSVVADLRRLDDAVVQLPLGTASSPQRTVEARVPRGSWELEALELHEPTGLELTNGHQNAENVAAQTQLETPVTLRQVQALTASRQPLTTFSLQGWRGVGAASAMRDDGADATVEFSASGEPGILRPLQPSDVRPVPVVVDPQTASAAGPGARLALTVDGAPVAARVIDVLRRFPTLPSYAAGFVVADEATLAAALDAQGPGQGRADELWISASSPARLRTALRAPPLSQLSAAFRQDVERQLRRAPIARGVLGTLIVAGVLAGALAILAVLVSLLGPVRDERVERDLAAQGVGPRWLQRELRLRLAVVGVTGVAGGLAIGALLTRLAVASVQAATTVQAPRPPLVTVTPWVELCLWAVGALLVLGVAAWAATRSAITARSIA